MKRNILSRITGWVACGVALGVGAARAADHYWSGDSTSSDNIDQSANWYDGTPACGDNLYFNNTSGGGNNRLWAYNNYGCSYFGNLILYNNGGAIRWRGNKTYLYKFENNNEGNTFVAEADLSNRTGPDMDLEINPAGSGGVTVYNVDIQNGRQLKVYGGNTLTISNVVSQSGSGSASLAVLGGGYVIMVAANTYAGSTYISSGSLDLRNTSDPLDTDRIYLGDTSGGSAGTLVIGADSVSVDNPVEIRSGSSGAKTISYSPGSGTGTIAQGVKLADNATFTVTSGGTLRFATGVATNIDLQSGKRLTIAGAGNTTITIPVIASGASAGDLLKQGAGRLTLAATGGVTAVVYLDEGVVALGNATAMGTNTINLGKNDGSSLNASLYATGGVTVVNPVSVRAPNSGTVTIGQEDTAADNAFAGPIQVSNATLNVTAPSGRAITLAGVLSSTGSLAATGSGTKFLANSGNTYSGRTVIQAGTLAIGADGQLGAVPGSPAHAKLDLWSTGTLRGTNDFTLNANRYLVLGSVNGPSITVDAGRTLTYGGVMGGDANWNKKGDGTLALTGTASTNKGQVSIQAGTLRIDNDRALGEVPAAAATKVDIWNTGTFEAGGTFTLDANRSISVGTVNGPKISATGGSTMTTAAKITGSANWSKEGTGTLKLTGASSDYTGTLAINAGALNAQHQNALGTTAGGTTVASGGALQLEGGVTTLAEALGLSGSGVSSDGALRNISGNNTYAGAITLNAASRINADAGTLTLDVASGNAVAGTAVGLSLGGAGGISVKDPIALTTGGITKDGAGTVSLWTANDLSGDTAVSAGALKLLNGTGSASGAGTVRVELTGSVTGTGRVYRLAIGNGGTLAPGASPATLTAGDTTWDTNGVYAWEINDFTGTSGADPGWDRLNCTGALTIAATVGNTFTVRVTSLTLANAAGSAANFNNLSGYTQLIASAASIGGFATNLFTVDAAGFSNPFSGTWGIALIDSTNIAVVYTPPAEGDLSVLGNNNAIGDGDAATTPNNHTDFGDVLADGGTLTRTFTITNTGNGAVGIGPVTVGGANAADFSVTDQPDVELAAGATTTFQVEFNPSAAGARTATLSFTNTLATAKNPYSFAIAGTGTYVEVAVSGNGQDIADGDATPDVADHTDFGAAGLHGATLSRTFTITNTGNRVMTLGTVTTGGTAAVDFIVTAQPPATLDPSNSASFTVQFNPSATGLRSATVSLPTTDDAFADALAESPFNFSIQGTGVGPSITNNPTAFAVTTMVGSAVAEQVFGLTNNGLGDLTFTLATNASWLSVAPVSATVPAGAGLVITARVAVAGLHAGVSNAAISFAATDATNSPAALPFALTLTNIPAPTSTGATADGKEMVRLTMAETAGREILVVHRAGGALTADPTNTGVYAVGDAIGGGAVIARLIGSAAVSNLEHVVAAGMTHYYRLYTINNHHYSPAVDANAAVGSHRANIVVETFSYTNLNLLNGRAGGAGWSNGAVWTESVANTFTNESGSLPVATGYPAAAGNKVSVRSPTGAGNSRNARRDIPAVASGRVYAAFVVSYEFAEVGNEQHYVGMSFMSNTTELAFFGEGADADETVSVNMFGGGTPATRNVTLSNGFNQAYTIVGAYDFGSRVLKVKAYHNATNTLAAQEPDLAQWDSVVTTAVGRINMITGLRLVEGTGGSGSGHPGTVRFDEIRFATNWPNLLDADPTYPHATNFVVNGGADVTDQQVKEGSFSVVYHIHDLSGIESTNTVSPYFAPNFDLFNTAGMQILTNETFGTTNYAADGRTFIGTDASHAALDLAQVTLGSYSSRWSAVNSNGLSTIDAGVLSNGTALTFNVVDDDTDGPVHSDFMLGAQELHGAYLNYSDAYGNDGFVVTGLVTDASGVFAGTSNRYIVTAPEGIVVATGYFHAAFSDGGAVSGGSLSNTIVLTKPHNEGAHTVTVYSVDYDLDRPGDSIVTTSQFRFSVGPQPDTQLLQVGPTSITHHVMLGNNASNFQFAVTNGDWGTLTYTVTQTYEAGPGGWVSVTPSGATLKYPKHAHHTGTVSSASFTNAGTHVMTNVVDGNQVNTGAQFVVVNIIVTNIPAPQSVAALADGPELVRLAAAEAAGRDVLVFHSLENTGADVPTNGNAYAVGDIIGSSRVIARFAGSSTVSNFEHVVAAGSTNYYRFYAINNDRYSPPATAAAEMASYPAGVAVEQFAYTNLNSLAARNGGAGWAGAWTITGGSWTSKLNTGLAGAPYFHNMPLATPFKANRAMASVYTSGSEWKARRDFTAVNAGKLYAAYVMAVRYKGAGKYTGMRLLSNGVEKVYFGETGSDNVLGIDGWGGSQQNSGFAINAYDDGAGTDTGNVYLVVGRYDFASRQFDVKAYYRTNAVPEAEPASWDATVTLGAGRADSIDGIEIVTAGFAAGYPGDVFFDEIRVSSSWTNLLTATKPYLTNFVVGVTNYVSDGQMTGGTYSIQFDFYSLAGMSNSATLPNVDILDPAGNVLVTDRGFTSFTYSDNGRQMLASNGTVTAVAATSVVLGVHTSRWSAADSNSISVANSTTMSNGTIARFTVVDDDNEAPAFGTSLGGRAMDFTIGGTNYGSGSGTNGVFAVTDGDLAQVSASNPMAFIFNIHDYSGIARGSGGTVTNLNFDVGASGATNIFATFAAAFSSADTTSGASTSVFHHTVPFTVGGSGATENSEVFKMIQAVSNRITVSAQDLDVDRTADATNIVDLQAGILQVTDDDTAGPVAELLFVGTNYVFGATNDFTVEDGSLAGGGGQVTIAYRWYDPSGLFVTNTDLTKTNVFSYDGNVNMNWDLTNSVAQASVSDRIHAAAEIHGNNGDRYVTNVLLDVSPIDFSKNADGLWYLTVSAQDYDRDRGTYDPGGGQAGTAVSYDRAIRTNQLLAFYVGDDDITGPTAPAGQLVATGHDWTNADFFIRWSTGSVTDASGISGYRISTNAPTDILGGTNAGLATQFLWQVGLEMEGVRTNFLYALDDDNDRPNDHMYGAAVTFTTRLDRTPPAQVTNVQASITGIADDSTQVRLTWTPLTNAGIRAADGDPLSPWKSYVVYYTDDGAEPTTNGASIRVDNGPSDLGTNTTSFLILSNLLPDTIYKLAIAGLDTAGNYGAPSAVVTQRTSGIVITQGLVSASDRVTIKWNIKPDLPYDVIYQDSRSWADTLTNAWKLMATVTNQFPADTGSVSRTPLLDLGPGTMRFYRVSGTGQWLTNRATRSATREIYVARALELRPGENWVALFAEPDVNTVADVLGTNRLPAGGTLSTATKVSWYDAAASAVATNVIWLTDSNVWIYSVGGEGIADVQPLPLVEGFNIEIPGTATQRLLLVGQVTTNVVQHDVGPGGPGLANDVFHVRSLGIPARIALGQTGLKGALTGKAFPTEGADEVRVLQTTNGTGRAAIKTRAWLRSTDNTFRHYGAGTPYADGYMLEPGDSVIIVRRNAGTTTVTNALPYSQPSRNINP